eukprot:PhF_6_TR2002/c1_g1_i1/m.3391
MIKDLNPQSVRLVDVSVTFTNQAGERSVKQGSLPFQPQTEDLLTLVTKYCCDLFGAVPAEVQLSVRLPGGDGSVVLTSDGQVRTVLEHTKDTQKPLEIDMVSKVLSSSSEQIATTTVKNLVAPVRCSVSGSPSTNKMFPFSYSSDQNNLLESLLNDCLAELDMEMSGPMELVCHIHGESIQITNDAQVRELLSVASSDNILQLEVRRPVPKAKVFYVQVTCQMGQDRNATFRFKYLQNQDSLVDALKGDCLAELEVQNVDAAYELNCQLDGVLIPVTSDSQLREILSSVGSNGSPLHVVLQAAAPKPKSLIAQIQCSHGPESVSFKFRYNPTLEALQQTLLHECLIELEIHDQQTPYELYYVSEECIVPLVSDAQLRELFGLGVETKLEVRRPAPKQKTYSINIECSRGGETATFTFKYSTAEENLVGKLIEDCVDLLVSDFGGSEVTYCVDVCVEGDYVPISSDSQLREVLLQNSREGTVLQCRLRIPVVRRETVPGAVKYCKVVCQLAGNDEQQCFQYRFLAAGIHEMEDLESDILRECLVELEAEGDEDTYEIEYNGKGTTTLANIVLGGSIEIIVKPKSNLAATVPAPAPIPTPTTVPTVEKINVQCRFGRTGEAKRIECPKTISFDEFKAMITDALQIQKNATEVALHAEGNIDDVILNSDRILSELIETGKLTEVRVEHVVPVTSILVNCEYEGIMTEFRFKFSFGEAVLESLKKDCMWEHDISANTPLSLSAMLLDGVTLVPLTSDDDAKKILHSHDAKKPFVVKLEKLEHMGCLTIRVEFNNNTQTIKFLHEKEQGDLLDALRREVCNVLAIPASFAGSLKLAYATATESVALTSDRVLREVIRSHNATVSHSPLLLTATRASEHRIVPLHCILDQDAVAEFKFKYSTDQDVLLPLLKKDCRWEHDIDDKEDIELVFDINGEKIVSSTDRVLREILDSYTGDKGLTLHVTRVQKSKQSKAKSIKLSLSLEGTDEEVDLLFRYQADQGLLLNLLKHDALWELDVDAKTDVEVYYDSSIDGSILISQDRVLREILDGYTGTTPLKLRFKRAPVRFSILVSVTEEGSSEPLQFKFRYVQGESNLLQRLKKDCAHELDVSEGDDMQLVCMTGTESVPLSSDRILRDVIQSREAGSALNLVMKKVSLVQTVRVICKNAGEGSEVLGEVKFKFRIQDTTLLSSLIHDIAWELDIAESAVQLQNDDSQAIIDSNESVKTLLSSQKGGVVTVRVGQAARAPAPPKTAKPAAPAAAPTATVVSNDTIRIVCTHYYGAHRDVAEFNQTIPDNADMAQVAKDLLEKCREELDVNDASELCSLLVQIGGSDYSFESVEVQRLVKARSELHCTLHVRHAESSSGSTYRRELTLRYNGEVHSLTLTMHPTQVSVFTLSELILRKLALKSHSSFLVSYEDGSEVVPITSDEQLFGLLTETSSDAPLTFMIRKRESVWDLHQSAREDNDHQRERVVDHIMFFWDLDVGESVPFEQVFQLVSTFQINGRYIEVDDPLLRLCEKFKETCPPNGVEYSSLKSLLLEWTRHMPLPALQGFAEHAIETLDFTYEISAHSRLRKAAWETFMLLDSAGTHAIDGKLVVNRIVAFPRAKIPTEKVLRYFHLADGYQVITLAQYRSGMWRLLMDLDELQAHDLLHYLGAPVAAQASTQGTKQQRATKSRLDTLHVARLHSDIRHSFDCILPKHVEHVTTMYPVASMTPLMVATCTLLDLKVLESDLPQVQHWNAVIEAVKASPQDFVAALTNFHEDERTQRLTKQKVAKALPLITSCDFHPEVVLRHSWFLSALASWCRTVCEFTCIVRGWPWPLIETPEAVAAPPPVEVAVDKVVASSRNRPTSAGTPTHHTNGTTNGSNAGGATAIKSFGTSLSSGHPITPQRPQSARPSAIPGRSLGTTPSRPNSARTTNETTNVHSDHELVMSILDAELGLSPPRSSWEKKHNFIETSPPALKQAFLRASSAQQ